MAAAEPVYVVKIRGTSVTLGVCRPDEESYDAAYAAVLRRERDAIDLHRAVLEAQGSYDGVFSFLLLETARAFAMLVLKTIERAVEDDLDRIQAFEG